MKYAKVALALGALLAALSAGGAAKAEPQETKLFVDISEQHLRGAGEMKPGQFNLSGMPVSVGSASSNDFGFQAGHNLDFGSGFSIDGSASAMRQVVPGSLLSRDHAMSEMATGTTMHYRQSGWDIAVFPELRTPRLVADRLPSTALGGSVARNGGSGWQFAATSRYEIRRTDTATGAAGTTAQSSLGVNQVSLFGAKLDLGYDYDWARPQSESATLSQGPSAALDFGLTDALNCRVAYRYAFAGDMARTTPGFAWLGNGGQDFSVGWDWDLAAQGVRGTTFGASFDYHQDFFETASPAEGAGRVSFAMTF